jgi:hypothetical protein
MRAHAVLYIRGHVHIRRAYGAFLLSKFNSLKSSINIVNRSTLCGNEWTNLYFDHSNRSVLSGIEPVLVKSIKHSWHRVNICNFHLCRTIHIRIDQHFLKSINGFLNRSMLSRIDHQSTIEIINSTRGGIVILIQ